MPNLRTNIRLEQACDLYLQRIANEGQSAASQYTARYALARFRRAVGTARDPNPYLHSITAAQMDQYCYGPEGIRRNIGAVTFNRYRSVLKVFFDYALLMRWVDVSPMDGIARARPDTPKQRLMLNAGELLTLLEFCSTPMERVACSLGMNTGLRANDIRHLTIFDASLASGIIQTEIRKTRKLAVKPISLELHKELITWLDTYAGLMGLSSRDQLENDWLLLPSYHWSPIPRGLGATVYLRPATVLTHPWRLVKRPLERMGYPTKGEGFHTLRRSSARALFESLRESGEGRDHALMIVKGYLNHASVTQTEHYLGLNQESVLLEALLKDKPFLSKLALTEQARVSQNAPEAIDGQRNRSQL